MNDLQLKKIIYFFPLVFALSVMGFLFLDENKQPVNETAFHDIDNSSDTMLLTSSQTEIYDNQLQKETKQIIKERNSNKDFPSFDRLKEEKKQSGVLYTRSAILSREDSLIAFYEKLLQDTVKRLTADCQSAPIKNQRYKRVAQRKIKIEEPKVLEKEDSEDKEKRRKTSFSSTFQGKRSESLTPEPTLISVAVVGNHTVKNNGFIRLRTTAASEIEGNQIPTGTTILGVLKMDSEFANIAVTGIKLNNGKVLAVALTAYDELGNHGLRTESNRNNALASELKEEAINDLTGSSNVARGLTRVLSRNKKEESIFIPNGLKMVLR